jgi:hypothetical protein
VPQFRGCHGKHIWGYADFIPSEEHAEHGFKGDYITQSIRPKYYNGVQQLGPDIFLSYDDPPREGHPDQTLSRAARLFPLLLPTGEALLYGHAMEKAPDGAEIAILDPESSYRHYHVVYRTQGILRGPCHILLPEKAPA